MRVRNSKKTAGFPPGKVVYTGKARHKQVSFQLVTFDENTLETKEYRSFDDIPSFDGDNRQHLLFVTGLHDAKVIERIGKRFTVHPLIQEDIANVDQRAKLETYDELLFTVMKMIRYVPSRRKICFDQVSFVLEKNLLIVFQEEDIGAFDPVFDRLGKDVGKIRSKKADYLLYSLIDILVDHYYVVLEMIGDELEDLDERLLQNPSPEILAAIRTLKREIVFLRKAIWPLREVAGSLQHQDGKHISASTKLFTHDLYDHVIQVIDLVETYKDLTMGMFETYNSVVANRMNEVMKVLTVISTIFIPLTFIAGVYGMNFRNMPELFWQWGYFGVLGVMVLVALAMIAFFRRKRWL